MLEEKPKKSGRGGKRPGAGAPKGNLNALKHGRRSVQLARVGALFKDNPAFIAALLKVADHEEQRRRHTESEAAAVFVHLIETLQKKTNGLFELDHIDDWRTIKEEAALARFKTAANRSAKTAEIPKQSARDTTPREQSDPQIQNPAD